MFKGDQENITEKLARSVHDEIWREWMVHVLSCCEEEIDEHGGEGTGRLMIPEHRVEQWRRQIATDYDELSEEEQNLDISAARKILNIVSNSILSGITKKE